MERPFALAPPPDPKCEHSSSGRGPELSCNTVIGNMPANTCVRHPELSGLVLSLVDERGNPQNGFLGLEDIYNLNLPADLVVLSACDTALGKEINGEGLIGLTRGFMYAGAGRVMASLWSIDDRATAELMRHFYGALLREGKAPAAALRDAQLRMRENEHWHSPYFWASFQIQGDY